MARRPNRAELALKKLRVLTRKSGEFTRAKQPGRTPTLSLEDRADACARFPEIQTDLAFETVEAYHERRMDDFAATLAALKDLSDVITTLCSHTR